MLGKKYGDVNVKLRAIYISVLHAGRWSVSPLRSLDPLCGLGGPQAATDEVENIRYVPVGIRAAIIHCVSTYFAIMTRSIKIHTSNYILGVCSFVCLLNSLHI
jgi:hypothetical protein